MKYRRHALKITFQYVLKMYSSYHVISVIDRVYCNIKKSVIKDLHSKFLAMKSHSKRVKIQPSLKKSEVIFHFLKKNENSRKSKNCHSFLRSDG